MYNRHNKRPVPAIRKYRRATIIEVLLIIVLCLVLILVIKSQLEPPPLEIREERLLTPPVHIITMEPQETPQPAETSYPVPIDDNLQEWVVQKSKEKGIDPALVLAIIAVETGGTWDDQLIGDNGNSFGLMQIYQTFHTDRCIQLGVFNLLDPYQNIAVGVDILAELYAQNPSTEWVVMAYNGGVQYADRYTEQGIISKYAQKVRLLMYIYQSEV